MKFRYAMGHVLHFIKLTWRLSMKTNYFWTCQTSQPVLMPYIELFHFIVNIEGFCVCQGVLLYNAAVNKNVFLNVYVQP